MFEGANFALAMVCKHEKYKSKAGMGDIDK
jgi:hypothetical protein